MNSNNEQQEPLQTAETTSYKARLSLLNVVMLYRSMLIRVTKRYSPEEVSFLVGEKLSYIGEMEKLQYVDFRMNILWTKHYIVHDEGATALFPRYPVGEKMGNFQLYKTTYPDRVLYQMNELGEDARTEVLFVLWDDNYAIDHYPKATEAERHSLRIAIQSLIDLNYFKEERTPFQLFSKCQSLVADHIRPINLYDVLTSFTKQKGYPKLMRKKSKYSGYVYVVAKKP